MNVYGYVRVSTQEQVDSGLSIESQKSRIIEFCKYKGMNLVETFLDTNVSASIPLSERPEGSKLLDLTKKGNCGVVAVRLDRLFRDAYDCLGVTKTWDKKNVSLFLLDLGIDTSTAMGRAFLTNAATYAELERNLISERTKEALREVKKQGGSIGRASYGWKRSEEHDENGRKKVVVDTDELNIVVECKALRKSGYTFKSIAEKFNLEGRKTKRGGAWHASTVRNICNKAI